MLYYVVRIKNLKTKEKYNVIVETKVHARKQFESLALRVAILRAIEEMAHNLTEGGTDQFVKAAEYIYEKARGYDAFINNLKTDLKIKVKAKRI